MLPKKNLFIAFEGIDGSGKSTQVLELAKRMELAGHKVYTTFEPTKSRIGVLIRDIFQNKLEADHKVIAGLFLADRLEHILNKQEGLLKKLEEGYTVITDRYYLSSYAYHGVHMDMDRVIEMNRMAVELLTPDLHIFIDIDPSIGMERINSNRETIEIYETLENLQNVRKKYEEAFEKVGNTEQIFITNGNAPPQLIAENIWKKVSGLIQEQPS